MAVTAGTVATWGKFSVPASGSAEASLLDKVVSAVTEHISDHYQVDDPLSDTQEMAIILQSARLWKRRDTPEGIVAFDELGAVRISRLDHDVEMLLRPQWGIA